VLGCLVIKRAGQLLNLLLCWIYCGSHI